jgi:hypothetical protein
MFVSLSGGLPEPDIPSDWSSSAGLNIRGGYNGKEEESREIIQEGRAEETALIEWNGSGGKCLSSELFTFERLFCRSIHDCYAEDATASRTGCRWRTIKRGRGLSCPGRGQLI